LPASKCYAGHGGGIQIGVFVFEPSGTLQAAVSAAQVQCVDNEPVYRPYYSGPSGSGFWDFGITPGDVIRVNVEESAAGTTIGIEDLTNDASDRTRVAGATPGRLLVGIFLLGSPVPHFGHIRFTHAYMDFIGMSSKSAGRRCVGDQRMSRSMITRIRVL
jgi:hypothetical protein